MRPVLCSAATNARTLTCLIFLLFSAYPQELVEKECTETEVLHMECRETGEFAHRETTKYEQQETFNSEVCVELISLP